MFITKLKASSIHLLLSFVLVTLIISAVILFWFPVEYLNITNFKDIALLIISIDLVLGPLLTFVVFNPKKASLKFDLAIIGIIQISALSYGVNALYNTHPLFITYNHGQFNLVQANEVTPSDAKHQQFKVSKLSSPKLAFAKMPDEIDKQREIMFGVDIKGEPDIDKRTEYYESTANHMDTILAESLDSNIIFSDENLNEESRSFLKDYADSKNDFAYIPLRGRSGSSIIVLDKESAELVTTINIDPWQFAKK